MMMKSKYTLMKRRERYDDGVNDDDHRGNMIMIDDRGDMMM